MTKSTKAALVIVDLQEDFCPPVISLPYSQTSSDDQCQPGRKSGRFWRSRYRSGYQWAPHLAVVRRQGRHQGLASHGPHLVCNESSWAEQSAVRVFHKGREPA